MTAALPAHQTPRSVIMGAAAPAHQTPRSMIMVKRVCSSADSLKLLVFLSPLIDFAIIIALVVVIVSLIIALILLYCYCWEPSKEEEEGSENDHKQNSTPKKLHSKNSDHDHDQSKSGAPPSPVKDIMPKESQQSDDKSESTKFVTLKTEVKEQASDPPVTKSVESGLPPPLPFTQEPILVTEDFNTCLSVPAAPDLLHSTTPALANQSAFLTAETDTSLFKTVRSSQTEPPGAAEAPFTSGLLANEVPLTVISLDASDSSKSDVAAASTDIPNLSSSQASEKSNSGIKSELASKSEGEKCISIKMQENLSDSVKKLQAKSESFKTPPKTAEKMNDSSELEKNTPLSILDSSHKWNTSTFSGDRMGMYSLAELKNMVEKSLSETNRKKPTPLVNCKSIDSLKTDMANWGKEYAETKVAPPQAVAISAPSAPVKSSRQTALKVVALTSLPPLRKQVFKKTSISKEDSSLSSFDGEGSTSLKKFDSGVSLSPPVVSSVTSVPSYSPPL